MTPPTERPDFAQACPCCGAYSGTKLAQAPALLAVCDVLVVRALEAVGKHIVRSGGRSRYRSIQGRRTARAWHLAHTLPGCQPDNEMIDRALEGAWDVVPAMMSVHGCCNVTVAQVTRMLDGYTRDLLITGTAHNLRDLRYRFEKHLGIPLPVLPMPYSPVTPADTEDDPPAEERRAHG